MPTEVSNADATVMSMWRSRRWRATSSTRRTPPSGAGFTTATSAAPKSATRYGSSTLRIDSSAATRTNSPRRMSSPRTSFSSSAVAHGCSM